MLNGIDKIIAQARCGHCVFIDTEQNIYDTWKKIKDQLWRYRHSKFRLKEIIPLTGRTQDNKYVYLIIY